jgi:NADH:ubiquinone oxidoreductase subunit 5 (subunit L)/multisubunit Na+/H+ antiporter MnhA subunit
MTNPSPHRTSPLVISHYSFICHSDLVIRHSPPRGALHRPLLAFLSTFSLLLGLIIIYFLLPAAQAAQSASPEDKLKLRALSSLLLAVIIVILFIGLLLTLHLSRLFFRPSKPTKTQYSDAWSESAKRLKLPPNDDSLE